MREAQHILKVAAQPSFLANEVAEGLMVVVELDILKKCDAPLEGSHQEDNGEGLGCEGVDLESLDLLKMVVEIDVLQKWSSAERHLCPGWSPPH